MHILNASKRSFPRSHDGSQAGGAASRPGPLELSLPASPAQPRPPAGPLTSWCRCWRARRPQEPRGSRWEPPPAPARAPPLRPARCKWARCRTWWCPCWSRRSPAPPKLPWRHPRRCRPGALPGSRAVTRRGAGRPGPDVRPELRPRGRGKGRAAPRLDLLGLCWARNMQSLA